MDRPNDDVEDALLLKLVHHSSTSVVDCDSIRGPGSDIYPLWHDRQKEAHKSRTDDGIIGDEVVDILFQYDVAAEVRRTDLLADIRDRYGILNALAPSYLILSGIQDALGAS